MLFGTKTTDILQLQKAKPRKVCSRVLDTDDKKNYADVMYFSDQHIGSIHCDFDFLRKQRDVCLKKRIYVILGGDLIEGSTRFSIGAGLYEQNLPPHDQLLGLISFLKPLADNQLIISICMGNHEERFKKTVGIDITSILGYILDTPYLGYGGMNYLKVGKRNYISYFEHGSGTARTLSGKMKKVMDASKNIDQFDVFAWGHTHELFSWYEYKQKYNKRFKKMEMVKKFYLLTGGYLNYNFSYADAYSIPPVKIGSPILRFYGDENKIEVLEI